MKDGLICHCLVGIPGSGKSTLATQWLEQDPNLLLICPDEIRDRLYGDPVIQGDWEAVKAEIWQQFQAAVVAHKSIIYDATNVKRVWRLDLIDSLRSLNLCWVAWQLTTPLKVCLERNAQRDRQVPIDVIIDDAQIVHQEPPQPSEGFAAVYEVPLTENSAINWPELHQLQTQLQPSLLSY